MTLNSLVTKIAVVVVTVCPLCVGSDVTATPGSQTVVAEVDGVKLTLTDLEKKQGAALFQARTTFYDVERKVVQSFIDDYLLERQARNEGTTVAGLLERHVNSTIAKEPSEEALRVYYEGVDTNEPYETVRAKIVEALTQRRLAKAKAAYVDSLRKQSTLILRLAPPRAPISMKDVPVRGDADARVTVLEYADYECPYCQQIHPVLQRIEKEFKGKIAFAYKDYPLPMHPDAPLAAEAAHCAGAQGKYWEYHDVLFDKKQLGRDSLKAYARELNLDTAKFDSCLDTGQTKKIVNDGIAEAQSFVLQGTPTIMVNGRQLNGDLSYERLRTAILEELSATGALEQSAQNAGNGAR